MSPTGNTLAQPYNPVEQARPSDVFVRPAEQPELTATITPEDTKPHYVEPDLDQLAATARNAALASWNISQTAAPAQETAARQPIREGIDTNEKLAYEEIANDGPAVVTVRRGELAMRATPEGQRA
jgi:hypothetical protein